MTPNLPNYVFSLPAKCIRRLATPAHRQDRAWIPAVLIAAIILLTAATARPATLVYTVTVSSNGEPVPGMTLMITVSDGVAGSRYVHYAKTNAEGSYTSTADFECNASGGISFGIGAVKILEDGNIEPGGGVGGSVRCDTSEPIPTLNLATSRRGTYDRHNAGAEDCKEMVGRPVNVTNGNMYLSQTDYLLPGHGPRITLNRNYNSMIGQAGYFGTGWTSDIDERVIISCNTPFQCDINYLLHILPNGRIDHYRQTQPNIYEPIKAGNYARIRLFSDSTRELSFKDGRIHKFDSQGNLIWKRDRNGNQTTTSYTSNGLRITITDHYGRSLSIVRDPVFGRVAQVSDGLGTIATYGYDPSNPNALRTVTYSDGYQYRFEYDSTTVPGKLLLTTVRDALDNVIEAHQYDSHGRATTSEIHDGAERYELDFANADAPVPVTIVRHKKNAADPYIETRYSFKKGRTRNMITKTEGSCGCGGSAAGVNQYFYDDSANLIKTIDAKGNETTFTYDARGNRLTQTDVFGTQQFTYNALGQMLTYRDRVDSQNPDPEVYTSKLTYDANGNLTSIIDALGYSTVINYPSANNGGLPESITDARNNQTKFRWAAGLGLLEEVEDPYLKKTKFTYDPRGRIKTITNALDHVIEYSYFDDAQRKLEMTYPNLDKITYKYDVRRLPESLTDERGKTTTYEFDPQHRLKRVTDPLGNTYGVAYDLMSNPVSYTDALGNVTEFVYDDFNRLREVVYPAASSADVRLRQRFEYDEVGRIKRLFDTAGRPTQFFYDETNRINAVANAEGEVTLARYDQRFQTVEVRDALDQAYTFSYDRLGRLLSESRAGGTMTYDYNEIGDVSRRIDYAGRQATYSYDSLNRLTRIDYAPAPDYGLQAQRTSFAYDAISRLTSATNETGTVSFSYDSRNRITSTTDVFGHVLEYERERTPTVNQKRLKFDGVPYAVYNFDDAGRLSNIVNSSDNALISFVYDSNNRLVSRSYPNGVLTTYDYDNVGRLKRLRDFTTGATLFDRQYNYDTANQIASVADATGVRMFSYDLTDRLTAVTSLTGGSESYDYDVVGNRLASHRSSSYSYSPLNRLVATDTATYHFDANGNTLEKTEGSNVLRFAWDFENRLTVVSSRKKQFTYKYDALGRRVHRYASAGRENTKFIYDGHDVLVDDNLGTLTRYVNGVGIDNKLRVQSGSKPNYFLADHLGSTSALTDRTGALGSVVGYDSFGNSNGSSTTRYGFTGREYDSFSGFYYYRARWYDPSIGRFISEDPIGTEGGANQFAYVSNNPMNSADPFGLYEIDVHYYLTKYLALKFDCFGLEGANAIAEGNQRTDEDAETRPDYAAQANITYHALHPGAVPGLRSSYLKWRVRTATSDRFAALGRDLHYLQDTYSHEGYSNSGRGHLLGGHSEDKTATDVEKTVLMAKATFAALAAFAKDECHCQGVEWDPSWEGVIRAFAKVETSDPFVADIEGNIGAGYSHQGFSDPAALLTKIRILGVRPR